LLWWVSTTGTTWVTQICHSLRTRGDMAFDEITEVVPWDICALDCGQDLDAEQVGRPGIL
jgi:aryl sulfotransferase